MSVPVLMYHHVLPEPGFIASGQDEFKRQMQWLHKNGYHTLDAETFRNYMKGQTSIPRKSVLITFDDGWRDNYYHAYPVLRDLGMRAILFVVTDWVNRASADSRPFEPLHHKAAKKRLREAPGAVIVNWDEVYAMQDVFDIECHTHSHRDPYFGALPDLEEDLHLARETLTTKLGKMSAHLCWPRGVFSDADIQTATHAGFDMLYTIQRGSNTAGKNPLHIHRLAAKKDDRWLSRTLPLFRNAWIAKLYASIKPQ